MLAGAAQTQADADNLENAIPVPPPVSANSPARLTGVPSLETLRGLFPDLEILDVLGAGGMGAVFKARQPRLNRLVALKIMMATPGNEVDFALRFEREAQVLARLNHPHIVILYDFGELGPERTGADPLFYFLMEYVDGTDLGQLIKSKELQPAQALAIVPQICEALQYAHDQGITHRDIKPANILINQNGIVKIADFGLAKVVGGSADEALLTGLTQTGTAMGTPHYMAPEQWEHPELVDHRADIYALGVVFYEMLTGELPAGVFEPPSKKSKSPVDKKLDGVVMRAMDKDPERRYQQAGQIGEDVTRISGANKSRPATTDGVQMPGRSRFKPLLAMVVATPLAFGGWKLWQDRAAGPPAALQPRTAVGTPSSLPAKPGRLHGTGTLLSGKALDLKRCGVFDDFVDVAGGPDSWVALRANGQTLSSDGQADFTGIRKIARSYGAYHCFIDDIGGLRFHPAREMTLPAILKGRVIVDAACGSHHGVALLEDGQAMVFGKRYEEAMEDSTQIQGIGTPRWPQPNPAALQNVKGVAVTLTHAATLHHDGSVSVWGWGGPVTWQSEPKMKPVRQISSFHDALHLLDEAGQVWSFALPRSVHPDQPVGFDGRVRRQAEQVARLRDHLWLRQDGTWGGVEADRPTIEMLASVKLRQETNFALQASIAGPKPYGYALWIGPEMDDEGAARPAESVKGRLRASGITANGKPHDLTKFAAYDDFVDVAGGWGRWVALRANGQTISSDGKADFTDIARIAASFNSEYAFISTTGKLVIPDYEVWTLPAELEQGVVDAALGMQHGIALLGGGRAVVFGARYEGVVGDLADPKQYGTPQWPTPDASALEKVQAVAATVTHAATLHDDGTLSVWGWEGSLKWQADPRQQRLRQLRSTEDGFWALDEAGQLWHLPVPRNPAPGQPVRVTDKPSLSEAGVTHLRPRCWRRKSGEWAAHLSIKEGMEMMKEAGLSESTAFSLSGGMFDGKPFASLLWIQSKAEAPAQAAPSAFKGRVAGMGFHLDGKPLDLKKAEGITDFVQVMLTDRGWVGLRANGEQVTDVGVYESKDIVRLLPAWFNSYGTLDGAGRLSIERQASAEVKTIPEDVQRIGVVDACWDGGQAIALLKDGTVRVWGEHYTRDHEGPKWPAPPPEALQNVRKIAITHWRAATLRHDGKWFIWGGHGTTPGLFDLESFAKWGEIADIQTSYEPFRVLARDGKVYNLGGRRPLDGGLVAEDIEAISDMLLLPRGSSVWTWNDKTRANAQKEVDTMLKQIGNRPRDAFDLRIVGDMAGSDVAAVWIEEVPAGSTVAPPASGLPN